MGEAKVRQSEFNLEQSLAFHVSINVQGVLHPVLELGNTYLLYHG